jgi:hypothetical protein
MYLPTSCLKRHAAPRVASSRRPLRETLVPPHRHPLPCSVPSSPPAAAIVQGRAAPVKGAAGRWLFSGLRAEAWRKAAVLGPVRHRRWGWVILPTPWWRLAAPPSRPLAAFPTFVPPLPCRFRSCDYRTTLHHSRSDIPLDPSSGHHGFSPAFWADAPSVGVGVRWRLRCGVVCVADPVVAGRIRGLDLPAADQSSSLSDADRALLRVGDWLRSGPPKSGTGSSGHGVRSCGRWCWSSRPSAVLHEAGCVEACSSGRVLLLAWSNLE